MIACCHDDWYSLLQLHGALTSDVLSFETYSFLLSYLIIYLCLSSADHEGWARFIEPYKSARCSRSRRQDRIESGEQVWLT